LHTSIFTENDKDQVFDLYDEVYDLKITDEWWDWRFNKFGNPIRYLMWDDKKLVGHYVLHPIPLKFENETILGLQSMSILTHKSYQNKGIIFPTLAKLAYEEALKQNYKIILGFPNSLSYRFCFEYLDWIKFSNIVEFNKNLECSDSISESYLLEIEKCENFDFIEILWKEYNQNYPSCISRISSFLKWRFQECPRTPFTNRPSFQYFPFLIKKNNEIKLFFVLKIYGNKCHIVDYFGNLESETIETMLLYSINFCKKNKLRSLNFWSNLDYDSPIIDMGKKLDFTMNQTSSYFGILPLCKTSNNIINKKNWFITMSDSDNF
jgi:hypothetical protein